MEIQTTLGNPRRIADAARESRTGAQTTEFGVNALPAFREALQQPFLLNIKGAGFKRTWVVGFE